MNLEQLSANLKSIIQNFDALIVEFLEYYVPEIIDLNTQQLREGYLADGERTWEYASADYARLKRALGSISGGHADLYLTGDFHEGFFADVNSREIVIDSKDKKRGELVFKYTQEIFGVERARLDAFIDDILKPAFIDFMKARL